jgi:predicted NBD/HSP70 family sugar kinase
MEHEQFQELLDALVKHSGSGVGQEVLGEVLARTSLLAPDDTSRVEISDGNPTARRAVDRHKIPQGTVSKAVKALMEEGLLETGEQLRWKGDRPVAPLRFGSKYAIAGVKVIRSNGRPSQVTTQLVGLNTTRVLGTAHDAADNWDQVAELIYRHVTSLKELRDQERAEHGLPPLRMFGVGVEVGAPVHDGEVMPLSSDGTPVPLAAMLHRLFGADPRFHRPVPVIVENDANALAVFAIHQIHYADPDLVVVAVYDEGVGGGLVMDARLRRGGNGRAMEIGHLSVGREPGKEPGRWDVRERKLESSQPVTMAKVGFDAPCSCGGLGHVETLATPSRIEAELDDGPFQQLCQIDSRDSRFRRAHKEFTRSGAALGQALAHVSNTVNPSKILLYLPAPLADPLAGTAGAAYLSAVEEEANSAFAARDQASYLTPSAFPRDTQEAALLGARAAAVCVIESFIEHALRLDGCKPGSRRTATVGSTPTDSATAEKESVEKATLTSMVTAK